jgi:hypothetical protein
MWVAHLRCAGGRHALARGEEALDGGGGVGVYDRLGMGEERREDGHHHTEDLRIGGGQVRSGETTLC